MDRDLLLPVDLPVWVDGKLFERSERALRADDSAYLEGLGCYSTTRVVDGRPRWPDRHARRLRRDAASLGIGDVAVDRVEQALRECAAAAFGDGDGVLRVQASRDGAERVHLAVVPRDLGPEPARWSAVTAPFPHAGPMPWGGAKVTNHLAISIARRHAQAHGADEVLLVDASGRVVEGGRSNWLVVEGDGAPRAADPALGGVRGLALEVLRERLPDLAFDAIPCARLDAAREIIVINAVRGAIPLVALDGSPVGDGSPGPWAARLASLLAED